MRSLPLRRIVGRLTGVASAAALSLGVLGCSEASSDGDPAVPASTTAAAAPTTGPAEPVAVPATTEAPSGAEPAATTLPIVPLEVTQIPGDPPEITVSALREGITASQLPEPLVAPNDILSGGPPPDGIPPIEAPEFERASDVEYVQAQEAVVTITVNGDARAYPVQVMIWHEIVNDTIGGEPVTVTYCPLCNTAIAYHRQLGDRILDFGTSGKLYNSALVMYDRQTESLWTHFTGQAIAGTLTGAQLELIPMATIAFETFQAEHPNGLVLSRPRGFGRSYGVNPYVDYDRPDGDPYFFGDAPDSQLPPQTRVLVIRHAGDAVAVVHEALATAGVMSVDMGDAEVVAFHLPGTATPIQNSQVALGRDVGATAVYDPTVDGQRLTFTRVPDATSSGALGAFVDDQTGSIWSLLGRALEGSLAGAQLRPVEHVDTFWFAAAAFDPGIELLGSL
ncbi:DUF3179 domain-containing protein [Candidatus Poriferisodalis sp.]|uniref:DUF3179 domain-containing protein n=1 Tax=Candidatus Poriferisodalis sp. TaxID=3101277 RepID=UPI003B021E9E